MNISCLMWIFLAAFLGSSAGVSCPAGFVQDGAYCYHFSHDRENWVDAKVLCDMLHAYLAEPYNTVQRSYLSSQAQTFNRSFWIGATDIAVEENWVWSHAETQAVSLNWYPKRPVNGTFPTNCAYIRSDGRHYDESCTVHVTYYICQKSFSDPQPVG